MKLQLVRFLFSVLAIEMALPSMPAHAQTYDATSKLGNGVVNAAGQWAQQVGAVGARANRNTADRLFQQALQHEAAGIAALSPGLLSQALTEARQGIKADDQARHFAQTSLKAMKTGNTAGQVELAKYGTTEAELRDLANNSSPHLPTVQAHLDGWGIKVDHDADVVKTPFGTFPISASPQDMASIMGKIAAALGHPDDKGVKDGVNKAMAESQEIAKRAMQEAQLAAANAGGRAVASTDTGAKVPEVKAATDAKAAAAVDPNAARGNGKATGLTAAEDLARRAAALSKSREEMLKNMKDKPDAYGDRDSDLFQIVHDRYQEMRRLNAFNEHGQPQPRVASVVAPR